MDEWELSKENVQPLKSGRKVANLTAALQLQTQPNNVDRQQIILQRQALEADLRSYAGDDPIAPWENYIRWTEQTFPRGGKESNMRLLLERCVQQFKDEACYKNDLRYVSAWLKLASNFSNDPLEMYQFMRDQGIGFQVTDFYEAWAWQLEQVGNTKKADTVYQEGINCKAVPLDRLQGLHREFQFRVARSTMEQLQDAELDSSESGSGPQRSVLGGLKGKGKHHKVGTQRTGGAIKKGGPGALVLQASNNQAGQIFSVFDENSAASSQGATSLPAPTGEWENMPSRDQAYKENERSAGPWAGQRVRQQRSTSIGLDEVSTFARPSFSVHVDDAPQPSMTPHKLPEMGNQVLSARKPEKQPVNTLKNIQKAIISTANDDKTKVMYCKHLIYGGATEMSIEEIRAIKVKAKKEERRLKAEREALLQRQSEIQEQQQIMFQKQQEFERKVQERLEQQQMRHEEELKRFQEIQYIREQELKKMMTTQAQPAPQPHQATSQGALVNQENAVPSKPVQVYRDITDANAFDKENGPMASAGLRYSTQNAAFSARPATIDQENQPMNIAAAPRQPMQNEMHMDQSQSRDHELSVNHSQQKPLGAPTPEEKHRRTVDRAQQQLRELMQTHQLNESVCHGAGNKDHLGNEQRPLDENLEREHTANLSCTQQLQFDETRTVNMQHLHVLAKTNQPTPSFNKPAPLPSTITPNASALFNTSSNTSQMKTPLDRSLRPDSRASTHSGRLSRITPIHTPGGIAAPSPTVNTKEALGAIMAMLNNPLAVDEGWRPGAAVENTSSIMDHHGFESEFAVKEDPEPPKKCAFTIAADDDAYSHLDNQENNPPKDYIAPGLDSRPRSGILQPSIGVPVQPLDEEKENAHVEHRPVQEEDEGMEGIEPIKHDENDQVHPNTSQYHHGESAMMHPNTSQYHHENDQVHPNTSQYHHESTMMHPNTSQYHHESTMMHHSTHTAFEAAARMASTPFNPQFGSERPSFSLAMSSIKAPMDGSLHRPAPTTSNLPTADSQHRSAPFSIAVDPVPRSAPFSITVDPVPTSAPFSIAVDPIPTSVPMSCDPIPAQMKEELASSKNAANVTGAARVELTGLESFDVNETTVNPPSRLSPIMETSNEDNPPSASSSNGSQSQTQAALAASHIQHHPPSTVNNENQSLHTSMASTTMQPSSSKENHSAIMSGANENSNQLTSFVSFRKSSSSSQGSVTSDSKFDLGSEFQITNDDLFTSTKLHESKFDAMKATVENGENMLANDMSSLMINDQSLHQSRMAQDRDVSMAAELHQNQSLLNHSSRPLDTDYFHKSLHESRLGEQVTTQNMSIHQQLDCSAVSQQQNQSLLNISLRPVEQVVEEPPTAAGNGVVSPWGESLRQSLLASTVPSLASYPGCSVINNSLPDIEPGLAVSLGNELYTIIEKIGQGAFAKIYSANVLDADDFELEGDGKEVAIKVESPACPWEFYISQQLNARTKEMDGVDVSKSLMDIKNAYLFDNASCLVTDLHTSGTLLDVVNLYGKEGLPEELTLYFAIELMHIIEKMHASQIIHGDIKPDNILLTNMDVSNFAGSGCASAITQGHTKYLKLIDMGRGIDMSLFPRGTVFHAKSGTSGFDCIEMQTGKPWTYQTDLYGLAGTLVCMLCGTYMNAYQAGGRWRTTGKWKRWAKGNWKEIIDSLLNITSCDELPSLSDMRQGLQAAFLTNYGEETFGKAMNKLSIQL